MQLTQGLHRAAAMYREHTASICDGRKRSWGEVANRVARLATGLRASGLKRGDHIALIGVNSDHYLEAYYAIFWAGCVAVPFNTRWADSEIRHALDDSRPRAIFADAGQADRVGDLLPSATALIRMEVGENDGSAGRLIADSAPMEDQSGSGNDLAAIFYTGGTTGISKGVMLSHHGIVANWLGQQAVAPYPEGTVFLHTPPLFHMADAGCLFGLTQLGATHVFLPSFDPATIVAAIAEHQITALFLVPTMITMLCEYVAQYPADLSLISQMFYGASTISEATLRKAMQVMPNADFRQGYGQTELSPVATMLLHRDHLDGKLTSAGRSIPLVGVRIADDKGETLPPGEVGQVFVSGPGVMRGYLNLPELTEQTIIDGWLCTGDAGYLDQDGYLYLVDRMKDMIVSGGENIYSAEVEIALLEYGDVLQCAVIAIPHEKWGEAVHAVIQLRPGATTSQADLDAHCGLRIARYKVPKTYDLRFEPLPMSAVGKILKAELRKSFWVGRERAIS